MTDFSRATRSDLTDVDGVISIVKGRNMGAEPYIKTKHCRLSRRQVEVGSEHKLYDLMGWETPEVTEKIKKAASDAVHIKFGLAVETPTESVSGRSDSSDIIEDVIDDDVMGAFA